MAPTRHGAPREKVATPTLEGRKIRSSVAKVSSTALGAAVPYVGKTVLLSETGKILLLIHYEEVSPHNIKLF